MERVFLSYSFRDEDREPARWVRTLIEAQELHPVTGENAGGEQLTPEVQRRIEAADAFIGIWTRRDQIGVGGERFRTGNWLIEEAAHARAHGKPTIVLVESRVDTTGMGQAHERIEFDRETPTEALLKLAQTIAQWRRQQGRCLKVRLTPDEIARKAAGPNARYECRYRLHDGPSVTAWQTVHVYRDVGGVFTYLNGVAAGHSYEIWLTLGTEDYQAPASAQDCVASLERV